jgi:hypothetical protein
MKVINVYPLPDKHLIGIPVSERTLLPKQRQATAPVTMSTEQVFLLPESEYNLFTHNMERRYTEGFQINTILLQNLIHWPSDWHYGDAVVFLTDPSEEMTAMLNKLSISFEQIVGDSAAWTIAADQYPKLFDIYSMMHEFDRRKAKMVAIPDMPNTPTPISLSFPKLVALATQYDGLPRLTLLMATILQNTNGTPFSVSLPDLTINGDKNTLNVVFFL